MGKIRIKTADCNFEREPLLAPFGFKGGYLSEIWQSVVRLSDATGNSGVGTGIQSVLWSDAEVFVKNPESVGNSMMFLSTAQACRIASEFEWENPMDLLDKVLPSVREHARKITGNPGLRQTFSLNSLVPFDNAAWMLYSRVNGKKSFDEMIPEAYRPVLGNKLERLAAVPLITYGTSTEKIKQILDDGFFLLKIKIGSDPEKDNNLEKMLEWDKKRLSEIHEIASRYETKHTDSGRILYYLDANGRYDSIGRVMRLLEHAGKIGALERTVIFEEPFAEENKVDVLQLPVRIAADESAHSVEDVKERIALGYRALALKPIAKTLSMSLKMLAVAAKNNIPCFCADLTVSPLLVDWNKNVAARLGIFPGMKTGVLESNGPQNYKNWERMVSYHLDGTETWGAIRKGIFEIDASFYKTSGGIFKAPHHYEELVKIK